MTTRSTRSLMAVVIIVVIFFSPDARGSNFTERVFHSEARAARGSNRTRRSWKGLLSGLELCTHVILSPRDV